MSFELTYYTDLLDDNHSCSTLYILQLATLMTFKICGCIPHAVLQLVLLDFANLWLDSGIFRATIADIVHELHVLHAVHDFHAESRCISQFRGVFHSSTG